jgi:hypothetical protein
MCSKAKTIFRQSIDKVARKGLGRMRYMMFFSLAPILT